MDGLVIGDWYVTPGLDRELLVECRVVECRVRGSVCVCGRVERLD